jgi:2-C-methyl-D-erythritol 2,4-cyclodiphosphate synthase
VRAGIGFDAHAFADDRPLVLGGVEIPYHRGLTGHSDADVLAHAICDAVLGAAGLGDIGTHFPSDDARWANEPSTTFLSRVASLAADAGFTIAGIDATAICEEPAIAPHRGAMCEALAAALGVSVSVVSVKATTTDGLGVVGRGEGAAAIAIAVLEPTG